MIKLEDITVRYGEKLVLDRFSLEIPPEGLTAHIDAAVARIGDDAFLSEGVDRLRAVERRNQDTAGALLGLKGERAE